MFDKFPKEFYSLPGEKRRLLVTDIFRRLRVLESSQAERGVFAPYEVQESDTPQSIAYKVYGSEDYDWIVLLCAKVVNPYYDWPLSYEVLDKYMEKKYPGYAIRLADVSAISKNILSSNSASYYNSNVGCSCTLSAFEKSPANPFLFVPQGTGFKILSSLTFSQIDEVQDGSLLSHAGDTRGISWHTGGDLFATCADGDTNIKIWEMVGNEIKFIKNIDTDYASTRLNRVLWIGETLSNSFILTSETKTATVDARVAMYDYKTGNILWSSRAGGEITHDLYGLGWAAPRVFAGGRDNKLFIFDTFANTYSNATPLSSVVYGKLHIIDTSSNSVRLVLNDNTNYNALDTRYYTANGTFETVNSRSNVIVHDIQSDLIAIQTNSNDGRLEKYNTSFGTYVSGDTILSNTSNGAFSGCALSSWNYGIAYNASKGYLEKTFLGASESEKNTPIEGELIHTDSNFHYWASLPTFDNLREEILDGSNSAGYVTLRDTTSNAEFLYAPNTITVTKPVIIAGNTVTNGSSVGTISDYKKTLEQVIVTNLKGSSFPYGTSTYTLLSLGVSGKPDAFIDKRDGQDNSPVVKHSEAPHHYVSDYYYSKDGKRVRNEEQRFSSNTSEGVTLTGKGPVSNRQYEEELNNKRKTIILLLPKYLQEFEDEFTKRINGSL